MNGTTARRTLLQACVLIVVGSTLSAQGRDSAANRQDTVPAGARDSTLATVVEQPPAVLSCPTPVYPPQIRPAQMEATVVLAFIIDTLGRVEPGWVRVMSASSGELVNSAMDAVLGCKFRPARVAGKAVRVRVDLPFNFRRRRSR